MVLEMLHQNTEKMIGIIISNINISDYITALAILIGLIIIFRFIKFVLLNKLEILSRKTKSDIDDVLIDIINSIRWYFYIALSLYISLKYLTLPQEISDILDFLMFLIVIYYAAKSMHVIIDYAVKKKVEYETKKEKEYDNSVLSLISKIMKGIVWVLAVLLTLSNLGYDITALMAGLGIGGIAVAFALQNVLSDIFASFSIYFDKPFKVGDFIVIGDDSGVVKKIGIKSTRITTLQGEELIISNKELTEARIHNYKLMKKRRVSFNFGVIYETPNKKLKKIPNIVKNIIDRVDLAECDRVHFHRFADSSLVYEIVYYINSKDYNKYMGIQEKINLGIKDAFEKEKIEMAYPTQTLYFNKLKKK